MTIKFNKGRRILGLNLGHDGATAYILDGELKFSFESEKNNGSRHAAVNAETILKALSACDGIPDVIALSGSSSGANPGAEPIGAGYFGIDSISEHPFRFMGESISSFTSNHERSHILCAYGLSPFKQGLPCYALVWEGYIGSFYFVDEQVSITKLSDVLINPGMRYAFLYAIADPTFKMSRGAIRLSDAGKLMALASYAVGTVVCKDGHTLVDRILDANISAEELWKEDFINNRFYNCGVTDPDFAGVVQLLSDRLYEIYESAARSVIRDKHPLLIAGGCGLNCEWNSRWINSGLFNDVFIPPCANDSGSAIGTAIDAMLYHTGNAKVQWSIYSGEAPVADIGFCPGFVENSYDAMQVAMALKDNKVLGWMRGRYEMGPRALGARSILASPTSRNMLCDLNEIKCRENFRPIAPICLEEDMGKYFSPATPSPYMLEFRKVVSKLIPAVTHVDLSARPQSVSSNQNEDLHTLLINFKEITGISVLCNTSLNFNGRGFLNCLSDLYKFSMEHGLDGFVFEDRFFLREDQ
jgi:hydroxymethyl cephem carbamoyltransferase